MTRPGKAEAGSRSQVALDIGARIARHREARRWRQKELAERAGFRVQRLSLVENGHHVPNVYELLRLRQVLSVSLDELLMGEPAQPPVLLDAIQRLESVASAGELRHVRRFLEVWIAFVRSETKRRSAAKKGPAA
jgi:transcriptional regulator with XRE-family HTH domain